jgi:hypothetical protein
MKKALFASVAAVALIAAPAFAQRQEAPPSDVKGAAPPPAAIQNAPADKIAPGGKMAPNRGADSRAPRSDTTGQASPSGRSAPEADMKPRAGSDTKSGDKPGMKGETRPSNAQRPGSATDTQARPGGATTDTQANTRASGNQVSLTSEQRTKIRSTVLTSSAPRVTNINFSVNVGTVVPRSVRMVAVPAPLIEIHPAWRGYMYFVHADQIVIVEPRTLRIVTILEV